MCLQHYPRVGSHGGLGNIRQEVLLLVISVTHFRYSVKLDIGCVASLAA